MARGCGEGDGPPPGLSLRVCRGRLLGTLLRPCTLPPSFPASGLLPSPAWAMHYPRKIEDLMEVISTQGSHSIQLPEEGRAALVGGFAHPEIGVHLSGPWN